MYDYGYTAESVVDATIYNVGLLGLFMGMMIFYAIIGLISLISYAKIFKKAGKPWWAIFVPFYNTIVMIEIAKLPIWYLILLLFVPIANIYALFKINIEIAKRFGKSTGFGIGMTLLSVIFIPLLAFSDNVYEGSESESKINNESNNNQGVNNNIDVMASNEEAISPMDKIEVQPVNTANIPVEENVNNNFIPETLENNEQNIIFENEVKEEKVDSIVESNVDMTEIPNQENSLNNTPNAFNIAPSVDAVDVKEEVINEPNYDSLNQDTTMTNSLNAFDNMPPSIDNNIEVVEPVNIIEEVQPEDMETLNENINIENTIQLATNIAVDKKVCKNCGNELPEIVSICPNCGTDNE